MGVERPVPAQVVALCILNTFLSYIQHLCYESYINQPLEGGWDPHASAPQ